MLSLVTMVSLVVARGSTTLALSTSRSSSDSRIARAPPSATLAAQADAAYQARDWASAAPLYERLAHDQPDGYRHWIRLGACLHGIGANAQALKAYETAQSHGAPPSDFQYGIAIALASMGERDKAFVALTEAVRQGHGRPDLMRSDPDLVRLRDDARFPPLLAQAERNQAPCDYRSESRQFDCWLGDWTSSRRASSLQPATAISSARLAIASSGRTGPPSESPGTRERATTSTTSTSSAGSSSGSTIVATRSTFTEPWSTA
jgi:tetratricopeptide (TPR) repeat protein